MRIMVAAFLVLGAAGAITPTHAQSPQEQLWAAAITGDTAAIKQAISKGANVHLLDTGRSMNGRRALNYAALGNHVAAVRLLLAAGASVDSTNITGFTPLHHAAETGSLEAAQLLLDAGARTDVINSGGLTPAQVARDRGFEKLAVLLESAKRPK